MKAKRIVGLLLIAALILTFAPLMTWAEYDGAFADDSKDTKTAEGQAALPDTTASTVSSLMPVASLSTDGIEYIDEKGLPQSTGTLTVTPITAATSTLSGGWYVVNSNLSRTSPITVTGDAYLILMDGVTLSVTGNDAEKTAGIIVPSGRSLTIYGQSQGTGELSATGGEYSAGIGANGYGSCGSVTINSGKVIAQGGEHGAGIGGGFEANCGSITINGGTIQATGGDHGAGIGGGLSSSGGNITIRGGMVAATGGQSGAGIGGGGSGAASDYSVNGGTIKISGGTVQATGGDYGAGIGGGGYSSGGNIEISGGTVTANGTGDGYSGAGIGGGFNRSGDRISISGGKVTATGKGCAAGIGGSGEANAGTITISGGTVIAAGGSHAALGSSAGIGSGSYGSGGTISFTGGVIFAQAPSGAYDVGAGSNSTSHGTLEIAGTAALFLRNNSCVAATTSTHARQTFTDHIANKALYGIPVHWSGNFGAYLRLYTLSYQPNGGNGTAPAQVTQHAGTTTSVAGSGALSRTGYTFSGWNTKQDGSGTAYASGSTFTFDDNMTLYAVWTPRTYTVHYYPNGGTGSTASSTHTYDVYKTLTFNSYTRTGYTFLGWATSYTGEVVYSDGENVINLSTGSPVYLYAKWRPHTYTIHYDANGGTGDTASSSHAYGEMKALTANGFTKVGYTFAGWAMSAGGAAQYSDGQSVENLTAVDGGTVTLYAKWTPNSYMVSYNANGGSGTTALSSHTYDVTKTLTSNGFTRAGYTFLGWAWSADGEVVYSNGESVFNLTAVHGDTITLYAKWRPHTYSIHYDPNGGTGITGSSSHTYDEAKVLTANSFYRTGYTFAGWALSADGAVVYTDGQSVSNLTADDGGAVTLYAVWVANSYTVSYDANGGTGSTAPSRHTYDEGKALTANGFMRTGYTFVGWATSADGAVVYTDGQSVSNLTADSSGTATLYAKWKPHTYTVYYDPNGGTDTTGTTQPSSHTYDVVQALTPNGFVRSGYAFSGWATSADGLSVYQDQQPVKNLASEDGATLTLFAVWVKETTSTPRGTVTADVTVRSGPGANYPAVGVARKGTMYLVKGRSGVWYKVSFDGKVGYILASNISVSPTTPVDPPELPQIEQGTIVNCNRSVNVRSGPGTKYSILGSAPKGATYTVIGRSGSWYIVAFGDQTGYISADYFAVSSEAPESTAATAGQGTIVNCNTSVNVRSGPGTKYSILGSAPKGATYTIIEKSGAWYKIAYNGVTAYISAQYFSAG